MRRTTSIRISEDEQGLIDLVAARAGISRGSWIRSAAVAAASVIVAGSLRGDRSEPALFSSRTSETAVPEGE